MPKLTAHANCVITVKIVLSFVGRCKFSCHLTIPVCCIKMEHVIIIWLSSIVHFVSVLRYNDSNVQRLGLGSTSSQVSSCVFCFSITGVFVLRDHPHMAGMLWFVASLYIHQLSLPPHFYSVPVFMALSTVF